MNRSELFEKFAACVKMVEDSGSNIEPYELVKYYNDVLNTMPTFNRNYDEYSFAIGIIDDTPIFVGDTVFHERNRECVITKVDGIYVYYKNGNDNGYNDYFSAFSLIDNQKIRIVDVKAFAIFRYNEDAMIVPANFSSDGIQRYNITGVQGDFGRTFNSSPKTQHEMFEWLNADVNCGHMYVKTNKTYGLIRKII